MAGLLEVRDLAVRYGTGGAEPVEAVRGASLEVAAGEVVGLLGESGCGKSTLLQAVLGLLPPSARAAGSVRFQGRELMGLPEAELSRVRGSGIAAVLQDPVLALNPVRRVGAQVAEVLRAHGHGRATSREEAVRLLAEVGFAEPSSIASRHPHELSGGQRQRVAIAQALACRPALLLADEPTSSLDPVTQAELRALLRELQARHGMAVLMASHDLGTLAALAQRVLVMYAGEVIEAGPPGRVFADPLHPYTRGLARACPRPPTTARPSVRPGAAIPGSPPDPRLREPGCAFEPRCADRRPHCRERPPAETRPVPGRQVRCVLHGG